VRSSGEREHFLSQGIAAQTSTPAQFRAFLDEEIARWAKNVNSANIEPDS